MSKRIELQIQGSTNFAFDVEGEWMPEMLPEYRVGNPPTLTAIREVWTIRGCRIRSSDGTLATLWTEFLAFRARIESSTAHPTYVRIVRDPAGAAAVLLTLGASDYEDLRFEAIESEADPLAPAATWRTTATLTMVVSAVRKKANATTGIVGWEQEVSVSYPDGLRFLEWRTRITTEEGTDARTKAQTYARIPVADLGGDHSYDTNGPDGIDYVYTDADEQASRVPTVVEVVSRARQWGVATGVTSGQGSPSDYDLTISTETTPDETIVTTSAAATGPNALTWCLSQKPGGATEVQRVDGQARYFATIVWVKRKARTPNASGAAGSDIIKVRVTGGKRAKLYRATTGGHPAHKSEGGYSWLQATVELTSFGIGDEDISLPGLLEEPWDLDHNISDEGEAEIDGDRQPDDSQNKYRRTAKLVYRATVAPATLDPATTLLDQLRKANRVKSYYLGS